jgi:hypothetical protein
MTRHRRSKEIIHEGRYAAEVFIDLEQRRELVTDHVSRRRLKTGNRAPRSAP